MHRFNTIKYAILRYIVFADSLRHVTLVRNSAMMGIGIHIWQGVIPTSARDGAVGLHSP